MHPSHPSYTDPNAPYRAALAALAGNPIDSEEYNQSEPAPAEYAHNVHEGLPPRRNVNRDRLNLIAHNLGAGVGVAMEMIAQRERAAAQTEMATSSRAYVTVDTLRQYLSETGHRGEYMADETIESLLRQSNVSTETLLTALQTAQNLNHPLWANLGANTRQRARVFAKLSGIVNNKSGFRYPMKDLLLNANNDPNQLIAVLLQYVRSLSN